MALKFSVIIPSYNSAEFIEETIQSIINQNYPDIECIVVDGGSDDGTIDILKRYDSRIVWISERDAGQSDAINKGLKIAGGDILAYLNADDVYEPDCFPKVAGFFEQNPAVNWLYGKCRIINEQGREIRKSVTSYKYFWQKRYSYNKLLVTDFIAQPAAFWRRKVTEEIGLFDINEHLVMDYDYWLRAGTRYNPGFIDDYLAGFRVHGQSKSSVNFIRAARELLVVAQRYARSQGKSYLIPLQYLNYLSVALGYSVLGRKDRK